MESIIASEEVKRACEALKREYKESGASCSYEEWLEFHLIVQQDLAKAHKDRATRLEVQLRGLEHIRNFRL